MNPRIAALEFIGRSISPHYTSETIETLCPFIESKQFYWEDIAYLANTNLVAPALWTGLQQKNLPNQLPEDFRVYLAELHRQNSIRNSYLMQQLLEAVKELNRYDIVPVALKGAAHLLTETFPDPGARIMTDIDLLVSKKHLAISLHALQAIGYGTEEELIKKYDSHHHYAPLFRPGEFASIEIHHDLMSRAAINILPTDTAWKHTEIQEIDGVRLQVLSPTYRVLHNILHSEIVDRHYKKGLIALRALSDLAYLQHRYEPQIDWPVISSTLTRHGKQKILCFYLYLAHRYLRMPLPLQMDFNLANFIHHLRCRSKIRWPWFMEFDRRLQNFSAQHISQLYGYPNTPLALTKGRLRYAMKMARKYGIKLLNNNKQN